MRYFCTLFDSFYMSRGLVMYKSLETHCSNFHLYIFAFDELALKILRELNLKHATIVSLKEFENERLLAVKDGRSRGEYCWTCTASTIDYCISKYNIPHCTYIDADLCFYGEPGILLDEMAGKSVLITEHNYTPGYDEWKELSGIYCVQFITFFNNEDGLRVLHWWRDKCIEWCFARFEDGKFGDQKYLDDWTTRFPGVHVLRHIGGGVAPWNVQQFKVTNESGKWMISARDGSGKVPLIFFHFHYLKFYDDKTIDLSHEYDLGDKGVLELYQDYVKAIREVNKELESKFRFTPRVQSREKNSVVYSFARKLYHRYRRRKGFYNVIDMEAFASGHSY
ncbi:MAG TPA: glycosyl transferase [Cyclobacteriaceae bacterium]|nr:glycosyl transferase [Cyclobacteriaceae bacterium]